MEPLYEYVKGKGWVISHKREFPRYNRADTWDPGGGRSGVLYDLRCRNCNHRAGSHSAGNPHYCPAYNEDGTRAYGHLETSWA